MTNENQEPDQAALETEPSETKKVVSLFPNDGKNLSDDERVVLNALGLARGELRQMEGRLNGFLAGKLSEGQLQHFLEDISRQQVYMAALIEGIVGGTIRIRRVRK